VHNNPREMSRGPGWITACARLPGRSRGQPPGVGPAALSSAATARPAESHSRRVESSPGMAAAGASRGPRVARPAGRKMPVRSGAIAPRTGGPHRPAPALAGSCRCPWPFPLARSAGPRRADGVVLVDPDPDLARDCAGWPRSRSRGCPRTVSRGAPGEHVDDVQPPFSRRPTSGTGKQVTVSVAGHKRKRIAAVGSAWS